MPHVYTMDPEDKTVAPVIDLDSAQESEDQSEQGSIRDVRVKDLRIIAQQQVGKHTGHAQYVRQYLWLAIHDEGYDQHMIHDCANVES